ncbi:MAG: GNAT family N-acetyltransferase [Candidatus Latescibacteria bacterium]|nr:GNAT family N-acetyltransferase [Candidatus Latescibacterota bacterium]
MENHSVTMLRPHMDEIPQIPFPAGYSTRLYRPGEGRLWTAIQRAAEKLFPIEDDLFDNQFKRDYAALEDRSFFIIDGDQRTVGTITAWWEPDWRDGDWGQIHWVAIHPQYQGKGLAKPAMTVAMNRLAQSHKRAFLGTSSGRPAALKVYLDFGFVPDLSKPDSREAWAYIKSVLPHPALAAHDL